jgi:hypothetical protein
MSRLFFQVGQDFGEAPATTSVEAALDLLARNWRLRVPLAVPKGLKETEQPAGLVVKLQPFVEIAQFGHCRSIKDDK